MPRSSPSLRVHRRQLELEVLEDRRVLSSNPLLPLPALAALSELPAAHVSAQASVEVAGVRLDLSVVTNAPAHPSQGGPSETVVIVSGAVRLPPDTRVFETVRVTHGHSGQHDPVGLDNSPPSDSGHKGEGVHLGIDILFGQVPDAGSGNGSPGTSGGDSTPGTTPAGSSTAVASATPFIPVPIAANTEIPAAAFANSDRAGGRITTQENALPPPAFVRPSLIALSGSNERSEQLLSGTDENSSGEDALEDLLPVPPDDPSFRAASPAREDEREATLAGADAAQPTDELVGLVFSDEPGSAGFLLQLLDRTNPVVQENGDLLPADDMQVWLTAGALVGMGSFFFRRWHTENEKSRQKPGRSGWKWLSDPLDLDPESDS